MWLAAPLRAAAAEGVGFLTSRPAAEVEAYCVLGALLIVVLAALRMALEMRESRAAVFFLAVAGCGWALASAQRVGLLAPNSPLGAMVRVAALLGAQVAMLTAILSYARRVCLEAEGRLAAPSARAKPDKKKKRADAQPAPKKTRSRTQKLPKDAGAVPAPDSAGPSSATAARRRTKSESAAAPSPPTTAASKAKTLSMVGSAAASPDPSADDFDENSPEFANLNKSERRRLRKLKRRDRRTAA